MTFHGTIVSHDEAIWQTGEPPLKPATVTYLSITNKKRQPMRLGRSRRRELVKAVS
jgi:hypothetical protein